MSVDGSLGLVVPADEARVDGMAQSWMRPVASVCLVAMMGMLGFLWVGRWPEFQFSNDHLYNLSTGYRIDHADPFVAAFDAAAIEACYGDGHCVKNQIALVSELPFNYPIAAAFGRWLAPPNAWMPFGRTVALASAMSLATGFAIASLLFVLWWNKLPSVEAFSAATVMVVGMLLAVAGSGVTVGLPELLVFASWERLGVVALSVALLTVLSVSRWVHRLLDHMVRTAERVGPVTFGIFVFAVFGLLLGPRFYLLHAPIQVWTALFTFLLFLVLALKIGHTDFRTGLALGTLVFLLVNPEYSTWHLYQAAPRANLYLAATACLLYVSLYPRGRLIWLFPGLAVFHVSVAGLVASAVAVSETFICLRRRSTTPLLWLAVTLAGVTFAYEFLLTSGITSVEGAGRKLVGSLTIQHWASGVVTVVGILLVGFWLLRNPEGRWDASARVAVLAALVAGLSHLSAGLAMAGVDRFEPGMYIFTSGAVYLGPLVCTAGPLILVAEVVRNADVPPSDCLRGAVVTILSVAALMAAKLGGPPVDDLFGTARLGLQRLVSPTIVQHDEELAAMAYDDSYTIRSGPNSATEPMRFLSLLKMKMRMARGEFNRERAEIGIVDSAAGEAASAR